MHDKELVLEILHQIKMAAEKISARFKVIHHTSNFTDTPDWSRENGYYLHEADRYRGVVEKSGQGFQWNVTASISGSRLEKSKRDEGYPYPSL